MTEKDSEARMRRALADLRRVIADGGRFHTAVVDAVEAAWLEDRKQLKSAMVVAQAKARVFEAELNNRRAR